MATLNLNQIPQGINSVERLLLWAAMVLQRMNPDLKYLEDTNNSVFVIQNGSFKDGNAKDRYLIRMSIQLDPDYLADAQQPVYMAAMDLSNSELPPNFIQDGT
jgi:hypothetical protein